MSEDPTIRDRPGREPRGTDLDGGAGIASTPVVEEDVPSAEDIPLMIERFVIEDQLGMGGMGRVYAAYDPNLDRRVAIKVLRDELGLGGEKARARMAREARAMARLQHPNVVTVYEVGRHEGRVFIVMEYVAGGTLRRHLEKTTPEWPAIVATYVLAGRGLAAAHAAGLVHRDFKPDNVLVDGERVLVTDFGIANVYGDALESTPGEDRPPALTRTGAVMGTPPYMSPEQHLAKPVDARTDQFAFCVSLYEALYDVRPFAGEDQISISLAATTGLITPPAIDRGVPAKVHDAVLRGLRSDPAERWPSMQALLAELAPKRRSRAWLAAVPVAAAAALVVGWVATREDAPIPPLPCDCENVRFQVPANARVTGIGTDPRVIVPLPELAVPDASELALPRGNWLVEYQHEGARYVYAVVSHGMAGGSRTITLPTPELHAGYVFVPGGEVAIGDVDGNGFDDERPVAMVHLAPYSIARREEAELMPYADALERARRNNARLPSAAEWEWAARLGVIERALANEWEWTATRFAPYPYDDERDDPFAGEATAEIRGGQRSSCDAGVDRRAAPCGSDRVDQARIPRRFQGRRVGFAELRLARTPLAVVPTETTVTIHHTRGADDTLRGVGRLNRMLWELMARPSPPALRVTSRHELPCALHPLVQIYDGKRVQIVIDPNAPADRFDVRLHPNPAYSGDKERVVCGESSIEILDQICFDGDRPTRTSDPMLRAVADSLRGNADILKVGVQVRVAPGTPNALEVSRRRAEIVRARLLSEGVEAKRLVADGQGVARPGEVRKSERDALLSDRDTCKPGDRVSFEILERAHDTR